ncbi:MAG: hypothetical protein J4F36_06955, partial [Nitrosopumilaceae archaeon]|nr:hypothetical protein [Nitrosopumilaceae archaeon]
MNSLLLILVLGVTLVSFASLQDAEAQRFHATQSTRIDSTSDVTSFQSEIEAADLFIDTADCPQNKVAVTSQWIIWDADTWIEAGITSGSFADGPDPDNIGDLCIEDPIVYYGFSFVPQGATERLYQEFSLDEVTIGELKQFQFEDFDRNNFWEVFAGDLDGFADANLKLSDENPIFYQIGAESQINPDDSYSSNPNTHFRNYQFTQDDITNPVTFTSSTQTGNLNLLNCDGQHFVAGNILDLDCNRVTTTNTSPTILTPTIQDVDTRTKRVTIPTNDFDTDYLQFFVDPPFQGRVEGHLIFTDPLPTTTHDSVTFDYYSNTFQQEDLQITVTDESTSLNCAEGYIVSEGKCIIDCGVN